MTEPPIRVLFVGTSNATRSIMAEALLRHAGGDRFEVDSAGTHPGTIHPLTLLVLDEAGIERSGLRARPVTDFVGRPFDFVITVCDDARAACPAFPGADRSLHWGYKDPAGVMGSEAERRAAFERVMTALGERVRQFALLAGRGIPRRSVVEA